MRQIKRIRDFMGDTWVLALTASSMSLLVNVLSSFQGTSCEEWIALVTVVILVMLVLSYTNLRTMYQREVVVEAGENADAVTFADAEVRVAIRYGKRESKTKHAILYMLIVSIVSVVIRNIGIDLVAFLKKLAIQMLMFVIRVQS